MGLLPSMSDADIAEVDDPTTPEPQEAPEPEAKAQEPEGEIVPLSRKQRTIKAREDQDRRLTEIQKELDGAKAWKADLDKERESRIRLEARLEEIQRQSERQAKEPAGDADKAHRDEYSRLSLAKAKALEAKDWDTAEEIAEKQGSLVSERAARRIVAEMQKNSPQQAPAWVSATEMQFAHVSAHENGKAVTAAEYNILRAMGEPEGPATFKKAFEAAEVRLKLKAPASLPTSERTRAAMSGTAGNAAPVSRSTNDGEVRNIRLPAEAMRVAKDMVAKGLMKNIQEYAESWAEDHPGSVVND